MYARREILAGAGALLGGAALPTGEDEDGNEDEATLADWDITKGVLALRVDGACAGDVVRVEFCAHGETWHIDREIRPRNGWDYYGDLEKVAPGEKYWTAASPTGAIGVVEEGA